LKLISNNGRKRLGIGEDCLQEVSGKM
jgi:hypothetical protein